jgi:hypothetical protein
MADADDDVDAGVEPEDEPPAEPESRRAAFERSRTGQTLITYFVLVFLVGVAVQNLPQSVIRRDLGTVERAFHDIGYDQDWSVFAPDPRPENLRVYATLTYADGSTAVWRVPKGDPFIGAYRDYRWQKLQERLRANGFETLWATTCRWLVQTHLRNGQQPQKVVITRETQPVVPLDQDTPQPKTWTHEDIKTCGPSK